MKETSKIAIQGAVARHYAFNIYGLPHQCEVCKKVGRVEVHHKDKNRDNNSRENLKILCRADHNRQHDVIAEIKPIPIRDIVAIYFQPGMTLREAGIHFGVSGDYIADRLEDAGYERKHQGSYQRTRAEQLSMKEPILN